MFFNVKYMTQSVPDSFNLDELSKMLESAPQEEDLRAEATNDDKEYDPEYIEKVASDALDFATDKCNDPLVHKVMAMMIVHRMIEWHTAIGERQFDDGNVRSGVCWLRDAGKFQSIMDSLVNIAVGPNDFTCEQDD